MQYRAVSPYQFISVGTKVSPRYIRRDSVKGISTTTYNDKSFVLLNIDGSKEVTIWLEETLSSFLHRFFDEDNLEEIKKAMQ